MERVGEVSDSSVLLRGLTLPNRRVASRIQYRTARRSANPGRLARDSAAQRGARERALVCRQSTPLPGKDSEPAFYTVAPARQLRRCSS